MRSVEVRVMNGEARADRLVAALEWMCLHLVPGPVMPALREALGRDQFGLLLTHVGWCLANGRNPLDVSPPELRIYYV